MGDYVWTTFTIGGKIRLSKIAELQALVEPLSDRAITVAEAASQKVSFDAGGECSFGNYDELEAFLGEEGLSYIKTWAAGADFSAGTSRWMPEESNPAPEEEETLTSQDGEPAISVSQLAWAKNEGQTLDQIIAWLEAFKTTTVPALELVDDGAEVV